jgi:hypothetical protein
MTDMTPKSKAPPGACDTHMLLDWALDDATRKKIPVDDPAELYKFA